MNVAGDSGDGEEIALFPLNAVLFPGGPLPLRIFETRYVDMVRRSLRNDASFGVVLILGGAEVGAVAATAAVGTAARIVDFSQLPDGLLGVVCTGGRRFRLLARRRQDDGLNVGRVEWLPEPAPAAIPEEFRPLSDLLATILPELGDVYAGMEKQFDDAGWVGCRLAEILPLEPGDKQALLEIDDPVRRLARLAPLIRSEDELDA